MAAKSAAALKLKIYPLTSARWPDLEKLFGERGACGGCWCVWWRLSRADWVRQKGAGNQRAFRKLVAVGDPPGLLAYADGEPVGWCAIAPRQQYPRLAVSRILKAVDEKPVWSVTCFFVARPYRRRGITVALLLAAVDYARRRGAEVVEGYPVEAKAEMPDPFVYTGLVSAFRGAGFAEVIRRSKSRPIMRFVITSHEQTKWHRGRCKIALGK